MNLEDINYDFLVEMITQYGVGLLSALAIFLIGKWVAKKAKNILTNMLRRSKVEPTLIGFFANIVYALMMTFVVIAALSQMGVETASLAAVLAAAGLAIGLALQGSLSNFAAGVLIIMFRPFSKGHYIEAGGSAGTVEDINIFTTLLVTPDNRHVIIPNSAITDGPIVNYSAESKRRIDLVIGVGYDDDLSVAKDVLMKTVMADSRVLKDPEPKVAVLELGDSSVNFVVRPWVSADDYWPARFDLTMAIKNALDEAGLSIPYPQRDVHIHQVEKSAA